MRGRPHLTPLTIFLIASVSLLIFLSAYEAYSVRIQLPESAVDPLLRRESISYFFSKEMREDPPPLSFAEVRSVRLYTVGATVTSAEITFHVASHPKRGSYITYSVILKSDDGSTISSGSGAECFTKKLTVTKHLDLSPDVSVDDVARVEAYATIGGTCW